MDKLSPDRRRANMRAIGSKNTKPELSVRRLIRGMGFRYRLHNSKLPGRPDIIFASRKKIIFVHGCFWHQHPRPECLDSRMPRTNTGYWQPKLDRNRERDAENASALSQLGWKIMVVWECEISKDTTLPQRIRKFLEN